MSYAFYLISAFIITLGLLINFVIKYLKLKNPNLETSIKRINNILSVIETFIEENKEYIQEPFSKFKKRFFTFLQEKTNGAIELSEEEEEAILLILYNMYKKIKATLLSEENRTTQEG